MDHELHTVARAFDMHAFTRRLFPAPGAVTVLILLLAVRGASAVSLSVTEEFSTTANRDAQATTAAWDTVAGVVRLPGGGMSWQAVSGLAGQNVGSVAFSPAFGSDRTVFAGVANGILRSTDGGAGWQRVATTKRSVADLSLTSSFSDDGTAFAITNGDGIWRSTDHGSSWTKVRAASGFGIATSPAYGNDRTAFAATFTDILKSTDGGNTWTESNAGIDDAVLENGDLRGIAVSSSFSSDRAVFASALGVGLYRSTDAGKTWFVTNPSGLAVQYATSVATGSGPRVAAAYLDEVYESANNGGTWTRVVGATANDLAYVPSGGGSSALLIATETSVIEWAGGASRTVASGWPGGAAQSIAVTSSYPDASSTIAGRSTGAAATASGYTSSAVATSGTVDATSERIARATLTANATAPSGTSVSYHLSAADGAPQWEGPVIPGKPWTFAKVGSTLRWRVTLATTDPASTPSLTTLTIAYETEEALTPPTAGAATPSTTSIRWTFQDTNTGVTRFELQSGAPPSRIASTTDAAARSFDERALTPNTEYCNRRVAVFRGTETAVSRVFPCVATFAAAPGQPTAAEVTSTSVDLSFTANANHPGDTTYAIRDTMSGQYVRADGSFGSESSVWQTHASWGAGTIRVVGLQSSRVYAICILARNRAGTTTTCSPSTTVTTPAAPELRGDAQGTIAMAQSTVPIGGTTMVTVTVSQQGAGSPREVILSIPLPSGATYQGATLTLNGTPLTDVRDGDPGDRGVTAADALTIALGDLPLGAQRTITFQLLATGPARAMVSIAPTLAYRPLPSLAAVAAAVSPGTFTVTEAGTPLASDGGTGVAPPRTAGAIPAPAGGGGSAQLSIDAPASGSTLALGDVVVRGTATPQYAVTITVDGAQTFSTAATSDGVFTTTIRQLAPGSHEVVAAVGAATQRVRFTVAFPPVTVDIVAPAFEASVNAQTLIVRGRGPASLPMTVSFDATEAGTTTTSASGDFTFAYDRILADGPHTLAVTGTTVAGIPVRTVVPFTIDRTPPEAPRITGVRLIERTVARGRDDAFAVTLEVAGMIDPVAFGELDAVLITIASEPVTFLYVPSAPTWSYRVTVPLTVGSHSVRVAARDRAGNVSFRPQSLLFDVPAGACGDGIDNDGDGAVDFPSDPDCASALDGNEAPEGIITKAVTAIRETTAVATDAIATATTVAAKATAETASSIAIVVGEQVLDHPTVEVATERVVAPAVTVAVAANAATTVQGFRFLAYLQHLVGLLLQPSRLFARRKRKAWGTVYASLTKRPVDLATVRLLDTQRGQIVQSQVTDHLGRYAFTVKRAGTYRIEVQHTMHVFPSAALTGKREDAAYVDLYHGDPIEVGGDGALLAPNIPVDLRGADAAPSEHSVVRRRYLQLVSSAIANVGLVLSLVSLAVSPRPLIAAVFLANLIAYLLFRRLAAQVKHPKSWGSIVDRSSRKPLHLAVVRLFDQEFNKLLETTATDRYGRYSFLVGRNVYYVGALKAGYAEARSEPIDLTKGEGIVGVSLKLQPKEAGGQEDSRTSEHQNMRTSEQENFRTSDVLRFSGAIVL